MKHQGCIQLILGPMFSGKTSELMRIVKRFTIAERECLVLNYAADNRYSDQSVISTHDKQYFKALKVSQLNDLISEALKYDIIAIDEGQFFNDLPEFCDNLAKFGKTVIVAALDGTFERKPFNRVLELIPLCEKIEKLTAVCWYCKCDHASFTQRTTSSKEVELIGGDDIYKPVCRNCFNKTEEMFSLKNINASKENQIINVSIFNTEKTAKKSRVPIELNQ